MCKSKKRVKKSKTPERGGKIFANKGERKQSMAVDTKPLKISPKSKQAQEVKSTPTKNKGKAKVTLKERQEKSTHS